MDTKNENLKDKEREDEFIKVLTNLLNTKLPNPEYEYAELDDLINIQIKELLKLNDEEKDVFGIVDILNTINGCLLIHLKKLVHLSSNFKASFDKNEPVIAFKINCRRYEK